MSGTISDQNADELECKFWNDVTGLLSIRGTPDLDSENEFRSSIWQSISHLEKFEREHFFQRF